MVWTNNQKSTFAQACRGIDMTRADRQLILRQFRNRAVYKGEVTSTAPTLTNRDFEIAMSIVESQSEGQVKVWHAGSTKRKFGLFYWRRKADDENARFRYWITQIIRNLELRGLLEPDGAGLRGWISTRVTGGRTDKLEDLTFKELSDLRDGLRSYAKRNDVKVPA